MLDKVLRRILSVIKFEAAFNYEQEIKNATNVAEYRSYVAQLRHVRGGINGK